LLPRKVAEVIEDRRSGASQLACKLAEALAESESLGREKLSQLAELAVRAHPDMAPLRNLLAKLRGMEPPLRPRLMEYARRLREARRRSVVVMLRQFRGGPVATLSCSSTVLEFLAEAWRRGQCTTVLVGESQPGGEGAEAYRRLRSLGAEVKLVPDSKLPWLAAELKCTGVVGADAVYTSGHVVNKAGTYALAAGLKAAGLKLYVIADTSKLLTGSVAGVKWEFDVTPVELTAGIATELGLAKSRAELEHLASSPDSLGGG